MRSKNLACASATLLFAATAVLSPGWAAPDIVPAQSTGMRTIPNSVILTGEPYSTLLRRLAPLRQFSLSELRTGPTVIVGGRRINFSPLLQNSRALFNVANRLSALPQHVRVIESEIEIAEVGPGIIIRDYLSYQVLPGRCEDPAIRAQIIAAGASCFTRGSRDSRIEAFSNPRDPRYVADPQRRTAAIAAYQQRIDQQTAQINSHISTFRTKLSDPQQRNALVARIGAAEVTRLESFSDEQLKEELINSAQQRVEQVYYIPKEDSPVHGSPLDQMRIGPTTTPDLPGFAKKQPPQLPPARFEAKADQASLQKVFGPIYYLTGFTYGKDYEWRQRVETTIDWCFIGCSETYYFELYAGFDYGFGLRFPVQATLTAHYVRHGNKRTEANVQMDFVPVNGTVDQFNATGLDPSLIFDAKELVAQFGVHAGMNFRIPVFGTHGIGFNIGKDFTDGLPPPFTKGHFLPPAPGGGITEMTYPFDDFDLLGGLANFGIAGAKVLPAMKVGLQSDSLSFTLIDNIAKTQIPILRTNQTIPITVSNSPAIRSDISFGNPVYNLNFDFTPGIDARLFVDIEVWSDHWDWYIWFPQLSVRLPSGGADFTCHAGTHCMWPPGPSSILWENPTQQILVPGANAKNSGGSQQASGQSNSIAVAPKGTSQPPSRSSIPAFRVTPPR